MTDLRDEAIEVVFGQDPRRAAEGTLEVLMLHLHASSSGLFRSPPGGRLSLFAGCSITQVDLDRANEAWGDGQDSILAGHPYTEDEYAVVPVGSHALVYLGATGRLRLDTSAVDKVAPLLLAALEPRSPRQAQLVVDVEATPTPEFERERLVLLLHRHEWNIARVARILGVYRPSVYRQLRRLGIKRERPPKK